LQIKHYLCIGWVFIPSGFFEAEHETLSRKELLIKKSYRPQPHWGFCTFQKIEFRQWINWKEENTFTIDEGEVKIKIKIEV